MSKKFDAISELPVILRNRPVMAALHSRGMSGW